MPILFLILFGFVLLSFYIAVLSTVLFVIFSVAFVPLVALAAVLAYGFAMTAPLVLLTAKRWQNDRTLILATPEEVLAGRVLGAQPSGEMAAHGFDSAWPNYFPYQAKRDFAFVSLQIKDVCFEFFAKPRRWTATLWGRSRRMARWLWWVPLIVFMLATIGLAMTVFATFSIIAASVFVVTLWIVMTVTTWVARLAGFVYGSTERASRRRAGKDLTCPSCYRMTLIPGYKCSGCSRVHRLLHPGPLGIVSRNCVCGTRLPTTPTKAAAQGLEVVCPYCDAELGTTAGSRPTVLVPVIGPVGVGKTTFLASTVTGMAQMARAGGGTFNPTNSPARQFSSLASSVSVLPKTASAGRPEVMTFEASMGGAMHDIQLVDAAGELFVNWELTQGLSYIDTAACWVLVIDPLTLPAVRDKLESSGVTLGSTMIGTGDTRDAYASVVDRFKGAGGSLRAKSLAIVVSKADLLVKVPEWSTFGVVPGDVRSLLLENGGDNLIRGIELDFSSTGYFAIESQSRVDLEPIRDPVRVIDWALAQRRMRLSFLGKPEPVTAAAASPVTVPTN